MPRPLVLAIACLALASTDPASAEDDPMRPVLAGHRLVVPSTGEVRGMVPGASAHDAALPIPGASGRFRIRSLTVDAASGKVDPSAPEIAFEDGAIVRRTPSGAVVWSLPIAGHLGGVRPPDRLVTADAVFVVVDGAVVALSRASGAQLWRAAGESDRLHVAGGLVLATSCRSPPDPVRGRCLVARDPKTGAEVFRAGLPVASDPEPIREVGDLLVVSDGGFAGIHPQYARFFDRTGALKLELAEYPVEILPASDGDMLIASGARTARIDRAGKTRWESKELRAGDGAAFQPLPNGDLVVCSWEPHSDSGVDLVRIGAADGAIIWKARVAELGVSHSKYWHRCYVEVRDDRLVVVSQAAGGHIVEVLELTTAVSVKRTVLQ